MKDILNALKTAIPAGITEINGISVIVDPDLLPAVVRYPFIGLKDGGTSRSEGLDTTVSETKEIIIYLYTQLLQNSEASMMGSSAGDKGLLDLMDELLALLDHNLLDVDGVIHAFCSEVMASETMLAGENVFVQRKGCRYIYEVE